MRFGPSREPKWSRSKTAAAPAAPSAQYVAVLQKDGGSPAFILTVDGATRNFTIRRVGAAAELGKSYELWLISDKLQQPRSLGVIGSGDFTARPVLASYDADIVKDATYAVTIEQAGGSPDGNRTSAPVFTGKLIETVPPAAPDTCALNPAIATKRKRPWGAGVFGSQLGGSWGLLLSTWRLWGAGKEPREFTKFR